MSTFPPKANPRSRRGASALEFALVLPIFLLALMGILEFGRAVMVKQIITNAAREGARKAILPGAQNTSVTTLVGNYLDGAGINAPSRTVTIKDAAGNDLDIFNAPSKSPIHVKVTVPFSEVSLGLTAWLGNNTLSATVIMRKE